MATEREEISNEGGRIGGKFQKRPPRRSHTTPYDRPPTALRNNSAGKGWFSKIVDPAQKLITSSAHKLFSSVFRKRLPPLPPPPLPVSREANNEMGNENQEEVAADPPGIQEEKNLHIFPAIKSENTHGVTDLEQILKEKTFTKFEIDRLTELLKSRVADVPSGVEERKLEQVPSAPVISYGVHERSPKFPTQDGISSHIVPTHVMSANVLDEDVASPTEIAKVYMGGRLPKATPLSMVSHGQKLGNSFASGNISKSSTLSLVPRSPGNFGVTENGFVTPRPRGRSALYSMARTPYSRVSATPGIKNSVATIEGYSRATGSSSSQSTLEQGRFLGSKEGALKRRSSNLDDEIGSVGSSRRIRQKSNLLYPSSLSSLNSFTSTPVSGIGCATGQHFLSTKVHPFSSSAGKALHSGDTKRSLSKVSADSKNDMNPSSSFPQIPFKSSEMASKILEQLETLTPPKEKSSELKLLSVRNNSPMKLSPSMLHGPALKSLEDVDSSKYLKNVEDIQASRDLTSLKKDKVEESTSFKFKVPNGKSISIGDGVGSSGVVKDDVPSSGLQVSFVGSSSQTKCSFQMSFLEDFEDMDEEGYSNGPVTDTSLERRENLDGSLVAVSKPSDTEAIIVDKPRALVEVKPSAVSEMKKITDQGKSDVPATTKKSPVSFATASSPSITANVIVPESTSRPEITVSSELPKVATAPLFGVGNKLPSQKESISSAPTFTFGNKFATSTNEQNVVPVVTSESNVAPTLQTSVPSTFTFGDKTTVSITANPATENGNKNAGGPLKFASPSDNDKGNAKVDSGSVFKAESSSSSIPSFGVSKEFMSDNKAGVKSSSAGFAVGTSKNLFSSVTTSMPTPSVVSFSSPSTNSNLNNGSLVSTPSIFSSPATSFSNNITNQNSSSKPSLTAAPNNSEPVATASLSTSSPMPSFSATPIFTFGKPSNPLSTAAPNSSEPVSFSSSVPSTSAPAISAPSAVGSVETKTKQETTFGNLSSNPPSDTSAAKVSSTGNSVFQFGAAASIDSNKQPENSTLAPGNVPAFGVPALPASSGAVSSTQSTPIFPFSSSSTSFGLAGSTGLSSGSSLFGSSAPATNLFTSGTNLRLPSSSSSANNSVSSSPGASSSFFNWQSSSTPSFSTGVSSTATGAFCFGLSTSSAASISAPLVFGSSSTGATTAPVFSFTSAASASSSQPAFGNSSSQPAFGNSSSQPAFGNSSSQPAFGNSSSQPAFGNSSSQPAFGNSSSQPAFGNSSSQPAFGNSSSQPAFGNSSSQPAFGISSSQPAFGISSSQPAFGILSSQPAFGISSSQPAFGISSSQPAFGNSNNGFNFGSTPVTNNFQANMEDSMAEDTIQAVAPSTPMPTFGQQPLTPPPSSGFMFGSTAPSPQAASPFQFGSQQIVPTPQNTSPFQASGSFNAASAGGSFSLGAGGVDKANRKYVKPKSKSRKK